MKRIIKILAALMLTVAVIFATGCKKEQPEPNNNGNGEEPELTSSVYLGIVGYNGTLAVKEFALLDESSVDDFEAFIDNLMTSDGSALYYSEYKAIEMLQSSIEPQQLSNVSLVTITAGLDNVSIASEETNPENYETNEAYRSALHEAIVTNTIHGKNINAYTLGLLTEEAQSDYDEFRANLQMLASKEENAYEVADMTVSYNSLSVIATDIISKIGDQKSGLIMLVLDNRVESKTMAGWFIGKIVNPQNPGPGPNPDPIEQPVVITSNVTDITSNSAVCGGEVISDGGASVTERGICWSTTSNPTISNHHANNGTGTGSYSVTITDLSPNTRYYVRAFATNSEGTAYGEDVSFITLPDDNDVPEGAIPGKFTIEIGGKEVYFSQGNLQYQASTNTWRFAENQYDILGELNANISSTYSGWIDLFGWGTSGYHNESDIYNVYYQPYSSFFGVAFSQEPGYTINRSGYGPSYGESLDGSNANYDWGINNAISNGGGEPNQWRTLTQVEWNYIIHGRSTSSGIRYAKAQVNGVAGMIMLPDDWSVSVYDLNNTNTSNASYEDNDISEVEWKSVLEPKGAVFFPAAGVRMETSVIMGTSYSGPTGFYWSVDPYTGSSDDRRATCALGFGFASSAVQADDDSDSFRASGCSVRLVRNVQ